MVFDLVPIEGEPLSAAVIRERAERDDQLAAGKRKSCSESSDNRERRDS